MKRNLLLIALCAAFAVVGRADEPPAPSKFYHLHFVLQEVDGNKVLNSREYDGTATTEQPSHCMFRTDSNLPTPSGMLSLGVRIDASRLQERSYGLFLQVNANITSVPEQPQLGISSSSNDRSIVRTNQWDSMLVIPLRKPSIIFSSDDVTSKHKMQLVLTATPIN